MFTNESPSGCKADPADYRLTQLDDTLAHIDRMAVQISVVAERLGHEVIGHNFGWDADHDAKGCRVWCKGNIDLGLVVELGENATLADVRLAIVHALRDLADGIEKV